MEGQGADGLLAEHSTAVGKTLIWQKNELKGGFISGTIHSQASAREKSPIPDSSLVHSPPLLMLPRCLNMFNLPRFRKSGTSRAA